MALAVEEADEVALGPSYRTADDLIADLHRLFQAYPCPGEDWHALLAHADSHLGDTPGLRKAG